MSVDGQVCSVWSGQQSTLYKVREEPAKLNSFGGAEFIPRPIRQFSDVSPDTLVLAMFSPKKEQLLFIMDFFSLSFGMFDFWGTFCLSFICSVT
jgi:hypothetical protein